MALHKLNSHLYIRINFKIIYLYFSYKQMWILTLNPKGQEILTNSRATGKWGFTNFFFVPCFYTGYSRKNFRPALGNINTQIEVWRQLLSLFFVWFKINLYKYLACCFTTTSLKKCTFVTYLKYPSRQENMQSKLLTCFSYLYCMYIYKNIKA